MTKIYTDLAALIEDHLTDVKKFLAGSDMTDALYYALFDYYCNKNLMPYGTAKARTGDPMEWVADAFEADAEDYFGVRE